MCGIVAALPSYDADLLRPHEPLAVRDAIPAGPGSQPRFAEPDLITADLDRLVRDCQAAVRLLARPGAAAVLLREPDTRRILEARADDLLRQLAQLDAAADDHSRDWGAGTTERLQSSLRAATDVAYALRHDRLSPVGRVAELSVLAGAVDERQIVGYLALDGVLAALDRLEVRGRDSAGISVFVRLDADDLRLLGDAVWKRADPLLRHGSTRVTSSGVVFVYKRAAIIGKLGDNAAHIRAAVTWDQDLQSALARPSARVTILAHTRWASVGRICEANAHPVDSVRDGAPSGRTALATLNGDIDNHVSLRAVLEYPGSEDTISTDAKLIPLLLVERAAGRSTSAAMASCLADFQGSMAIAAQMGDEPDSLLLAVKGSGQGLYVGFSETGLFVASEVYGLVASADRYLRLEGGVWSGAATPGTVVTLTRDGTNLTGGVERLDGAGRPNPVRDEELRCPEITTSDLARGAAQHYLEKEIREAAASFRKTLRGRVHTADDLPAVDLPTSALPQALRQRIANDEVRRVAVLGQGTAGVAAQGIAQTLRSLLPTSITVQSMPASEFSAYGLEENLSDTCVIAVSQSGSTTDTNRTVDLARARGASVIAIVNRRDSDLTVKSDGVLYTSDGRDVEMAVASTKAFYAQVAAGCLLGVQMGRIAGSVTAEREAAMLRALQAMPQHLQQVYDAQADIAEIARATAPRHRYWAVVGSGPNRVAAAEARIKLSELCYRTVSTDAVEDKKHIDLSAEALVLVCAAGAPSGQLGDLLKEVEILASHRNQPVVITDAGPDLPWATQHVIRVPAAHPALAWILSTAAAHLFAYHAAVSIDACADDLRKALDTLEAGVQNPQRARADWLPEVHQYVVRTLDRIYSGEMQGVLGSLSALRLAVAAVGSPQARLASPVVLLAQAEDPTKFLRAALTAAVDEMTRSIDTVKHQAKTVTVGTSRSDADLYDNDLVRALRAAGTDAEAVLSHLVLVALRAHAKVVKQVDGVTRYRVRIGPPEQIKVTAKTGVAADLQSRAEEWAPLTGSKKLIGRSRAPRLLHGRRDGRIVFVLPEQEGADLAGLAVVHVTLREHAPTRDLLAAMSSTSDRLQELIAAVTESDMDFRPEVLEQLDVKAVLLSPVDEIAESLRPFLGSRVP
ncbi:MAG TPA: SIS domain-containing protein [Streptosporangiaceae bacterium]|nr:SIS domain-containing protein [Streptosporangiaceae bacterium]